jgi:heat shock protein 4
MSEIHVQQLNARRVLRERSDARNALEGYTYELIRRCEEGGQDLAPYMTETERANVLAKAQAEEEWVTSEQAEDAQKSGFMDRLKMLQELVHPAEARKKEEGQRDRVVDLLKKQCESAITDTNSPAREHIKAEEKQKIVTEATAFIAKLASLVAEQKKKKRNEIPAFMCDDIKKEHKALRTEWNRILSTPKPAPPPPPPAPAEAEKKKEEENKEEGAKDEKQDQEKAEKKDEEKAGNENQEKAKEETKEAQAEGKKEEHDLLDDIGMDAPHPSPTPAHSPTESAPAID